MDIRTFLKEQQINNIMDINKLADKARNSISKYCYEECKAYCCRKGYLPLTKEQAKFFKEKIKDKTLLKKLPKGDYSLNLKNGCPQLKDFKCTIYTSKLKPACCSDFPIFIEKNLIRFSPRCPAVKAGKFYPYIKQFLKLGFNVSAISEK